MSDALTVRLPRRLDRVRLAGPESALHPPGDEGPEADLGSLRKVAYREGYERGKAESGGRFREALKTLDHAASILEVSRREFLESLERSAAEIGVLVAEKFLISERGRKQYAIETIVRSLIEKLKVQETPLTVSLHPEDLERLRLDGGLGENGGYPMIRLEGDPDLPPAGCRLDTGKGLVTCTLEEQMLEIRQALVEMEMQADEGRGD